MRKMKVIPCQPTQFSQSQPNLGGQACHHVRARRGQPLPMRGQLVTPGSKESGEVLGVGGIRTLESPAWRGLLHSSIGDVTTLPVSSRIFARVAQFQEPEEQTTCRLSSGESPQLALAADDPRTDPRGQRSPTPTLQQRPRTPRQCLPRAESCCQQHHGPDAPERTPTAGVPDTPQPRQDPSPSAGI